MLKQCFEKCVEHFHESELSLGENTCLDRNSPNPVCSVSLLSSPCSLLCAQTNSQGCCFRCVGKYVESQQKVGEQMAKVTAQMSQI